ncbi:MAG: hypothetical protein NXI32_13655, partial [bacterium]|nr:hypothetical protein [bacterium]
MHQYLRGRRENESSLRRGMFFRLRRRREAFRRALQLKSLRMEALESRHLLAADLFFGSQSDLTLRIATVSSEEVFQLIDSGNMLIDSAAVSDADDGGVVITGTSGDDRLTLDLNTLSTIAITFVSGGSDVLAAQGDVDFSLGSNTLIAGDVEFLLETPDDDGLSFAKIELTGGASDNFFSMEGWSQSFQIEGGSGNDSLQAELELDHDWEITADDSGTLDGNAFSSVEYLIGGNGLDRFAFQPGGSVSGAIQGGGTNATNTGEPQDSLDFSLSTSPLSFDLATGVIGGLAEYANIDRIIGGNASDTILGSSADTEWQITGVNQVIVGGLVFEGFENLSGADDNIDVFEFGPSGAITGVIAGGQNGTDGFIVEDPGNASLGEDETPEATAFNPAGADSDGMVTLYGKNISYTGMDRQEIISNASGGDIEITGTVFDDTLVISDADENASGLMQVSLTSPNAGSSYSILMYEGGSGETVESYTFATPDSSLIISGWAGDDEITIESFDQGFSAELYIYGNQADDFGVVSDDLAEDTIRFSGSISTGDGYLDAFATHIVIEDSVVIETGSASMQLRARLVNDIAQIENLSPLLFPQRAVSISIGADAELRGDGIFIVAQSEDRSIAEALGISKEVSNFVIDPIVGLVEGALALPVKVLIKDYSSQITIGDGATIVGAGTVGIYSSAYADSSGSAAGSIVSIGYAQANATSTVDIQSNVTISASDALVITSDGAATASLSASAARDSDATPNPGRKKYSSNQFAGAAAASYANLKSTITVADSAVLTAGKTANIIANGDAFSEADAETGLFADGNAALAFAFEFSDAEVTTTVNGKVQANMRDGSVVKIEIDPLVENDTQVGYVDYSRDMIYVGPHALVTEDVIEYTNRRGTSIGNLVDGREYYVIALEDDDSTNDRDESQWIQLAESETQAIKASYGVSGQIVDLKKNGLPAPDNNKRTFTGAEVDAENNLITLLRNGDDVFNAFELGQAVVYQEGDQPISGLKDGETYYVVASTNQTNLQGDTRLTSAQVIGLAESENEARGNVLIDIGGVADDDSGYKLTAKHVLDSGFSTGVGVFATLNAEDNSSASAGLASEEDELGYIEKGRNKADFNVFDTIFQGLTKSYREKQALAEAGARDKLSIGGALAFTYTNHDVTATVGESARLRSNEDLEVQALIEQSYTINANSETENQSAATGSTTTSAENSVSVAANVGLYNNSAWATVVQGAELDALRATRVISDVSYPFLTRFDEFIPLSQGEFVDKAREEGYGVVTDYLDSTLGFKDAFFNSWTTSSSDGDKLGFAGAVNVLVFTNESLARVGVSPEVASREEDTQASATNSTATANINQNTDWQDNARNPHPNQAVNREDLLGGEQTVSVEAINYMQTINMTGIFSLPSVQLDVSDVSKFSARLRHRLSLNPAGTSGSKGGYGGAFFISQTTNTTKAIVSDESKVYSGADGGFNMKAEEAQFVINLTQAGATGGETAVGGSVAYAGHDSETLAQLGSQASVTGRDVRIYAGDLTTNANWVGGIAVGNGVGAGIAIAINDLKRKTRAVIGDPDVNESTGNGYRDTPSITVSGTVEALAKSNGEQWAFSIAGAAAMGDSGKPPSSGGSTTTKASDSLSSIGRIILAGQNAGAPPSGFGVAAAIAVNVLDDTVQASIVDAGKIRADTAKVIAEDDFQKVAVTGGASFAFGQTGSTSGSTSLAGAFSFNFLDVDTHAFILDTSIHALNDQDGQTDNDLLVSASRTGDLWSIAAGGAISTGDGGTSIAGSVAVNQITNDTQAYLVGVEADVLNNASITATDTSRIIAIGGGLALSLGGKTGVGLGVSANILGSALAKTITRAYVKDSTLDIKGTQFDVLAINDNPDSTQRIFSVSAGIGVATGPTAGVGLGANLSVNLTYNITEAYVLSSTISEISGGVGEMSSSIRAIDDSGILSIAGAVGVSMGGGNSIGAAIGYNGLNNETKAYLDDVGLTANGALTVRASADGEIGGVGVGVAVTSGSSGTLTGAGSVLINQIKNELVAHISDTVGGKDSVISVDGDVEVAAVDDSLIVSIAGAVGVATTPDLTSGGAIGAAVSYNQIKNILSAYIENAEVDARGSLDSINLLAQSNSILVSIALGAAVAGGNSALGGSLTVNSIANTINAHIKDSARIHAGEDLSVQALSSNVLVTVAGGFSAALGSWGNAVGAAIAYNFVGGYFDLANPDAIDRDPKDEDKDQITAYIHESPVEVGGDIMVDAGYQAPASDTPISFDIWAEATEDDFTLPGEAKGRMVSVAVAGTLGDNLAISGSVSVNIIAHTISSYISGSQLVEADGSIRISAVDLVQSAAVAGSVALGQNGAGIGASLQIDRSTVDAYVGEGSTLEARGHGNGLLVPDGTEVNGTPQYQLVKGLAVTATAIEDFDSVAIGLAGGARYGVAGSGGVTIALRKVSAHIDKNAKVNTETQNEASSQSVLVRASDRSNLVGVAGSVALGGIAGIGAGIDVGTAVKDTQAWIGRGAEVEAESDVRVLSNSEERVVSVAAAGSGGLTTGIAGAVDVYVMDITTKAFLDGSKSSSDSGATVTAGGSVQVAADSENEVDMIAGNIAAGGTAGVGGAITVPVVTKHTYAYIGDDATVDALGNRAGIEVVTGTFATPSFISYGTSEDGEVNPLEEASKITADDIGTDNGSNGFEDPLVDEQLTRQRVAVPDTDSDFRGIAVTAINRDDIGTFAFWLGASGTAAVQISGSVNLMTTNTHAYVGESAELNNANTFAEGSDQSVLVAAGNDYQHLGIAGGVALGGSAAVTPGLELGVVKNNTSAEVKANAIVEAEGGIDVVAQAVEDVLSIAVAIGGSLNVGVAGAASVVALENVTSASIGDNATVTAGGNLLVNAADFTDVDVLALGAGIGLGAAGVGVGLGVTEISKDTTAFISDATVDAKGNSGVDLILPDGTLSGNGVFGQTEGADDVRGLAVISESSESILSVAIAGAGGSGAGVAGSVTVTLVDSDTGAYIDGGAVVNADTNGVNANQDVYVSAVNDLQTLAISGALGVGLGAGVAGGVDVGILRNDTTAFIAGEVSARRDIHVNSLANRDIDTYVVSAAAGTVGIGAAVAVYSLGGQFLSSYAYDDDGDEKSEDTLTFTNKDGQKSDMVSAIDTLAAGGDASSSLSNIVDPGTGSEDSANSDEVREYSAQAQGNFEQSKPDGIVAAAANQEEGQNTLGSQAVTRGTSAFIADNAVITAGRDIDLDARERIDLQFFAGGFGIGLGGGVGAGISILNVNADVAAYIESGATVSAATNGSNGLLSVDADLNATYRLLGITVGAGGIVGVAGAVAIINDTSDVEAFFKDGSVRGVSIPSAEAVNVKANRLTDVQASTIGVGGSIGLGFGAGVVLIDFEHDTRAELGDKTTIGDPSADDSDVGSVNVDAISTLLVDKYKGTDSMAGPIGTSGVSVSAGVANVKVDNDVYAEMGVDVDINVDNSVSIDANSTTDLKVSAIGISAGLAGIGAMFADAKATDETKARIQGGRVRAGSLSITSTGNAVLVADAEGTTGGVVSATGVDADAQAEIDVAAELGTVNVVTTGNVSVQADGIAEADATAKGTNVGGITVGISLASTTVTPNVTSLIESGATLTVGGDLNVEAFSGKTPTELDDQLENGDVDTSSDALTVPGHGLSTGDEVLYSNPESDSDIGGLVNDRIYRVLEVSNAGEVDPNTIRLGEQFDAGESVDGLRDEISFTGGHSFESGDEVIYLVPDGDSTDVSNLQQGVAYRVLVLDEQTIKLQDPSNIPADALKFAAGTTVDSGTGVFNIAGHGFSAGQAVTYRAPIADSFSSGAVDLLIASDEIVYNSDNKPTDDASAESIFIESHGFQTGDLLRYDVPSGDAAIGGLVAGGDYFAIAKGVNELQLASQGSTFDGSSLSSDDLSDGTLSDPGGLTAGDKVVYRHGGGVSIGGLADRGVYYVGSLFAGQLKLYDTQADAIAEQNHVNLTDVGQGSSHRLDPLLSLTPDKSTQEAKNVVHTLLPVEDLPISNLIDGITYYVNFDNISQTDQADHFQLQDSLGNIVSVDVTGLSNSTEHSLGTEGIDIGTGIGV